VFRCPNTFHKTYEARLLLFLNSNAHLNRIQ